MRITNPYISAMFSSLLIILVWGVVVYLFQIPTYIFPTPFDVWERFTGNIFGYLSATAVTLGEAFIGLILALIATTSLGFLFALSERIDKFVSPALVAMQSIPILAVAPLLTMWFGPGFASKVVAAFLVCFFPLAAGWSSGIHAVEREERDFFRSMGANRFQTARWLIAPRALPYFFAGFRVSAPLSILGAIVGEFVGAKEGLGFLILTHSYYARTADIFVCIIIVATCGALLHHAVKVVESNTLFWHGRKQD